MSEIGALNASDRVVTVEATLSPVAEPRRTSKRQARRALEHDAVLEIYRAHHHELLRFASFVAPEDAMAEDLVHEAFLKLYSAWRRIDDPSKVAAYLRTTVLNLARGRARHLGVIRRNRPDPQPETASAEWAAMRTNSREKRDLRPAPPLGSPAGMPGAAPLRRQIRIRDSRDSRHIDRHGTHPRAPGHGIAQPTSHRGDLAMNENDLRQALAGHASIIAPATELDRLARGMNRVDRMRTARTMGSGCAAAILVTLGVINLTGGGDTTPLDVINQPTPSLPEAEVGLPLLDDPAGDEATTVPPTTSLSASSADTTPDHLTGEGSSPTSTSPAAVVSTTVAPTSTPPTTSPAAGSHHTHHDRAVLLLHRFGALRIVRRRPSLRRVLGEGHSWSDDHRRVALLRIRVDRGRRKWRLVDAG